MDSTPQLRGEEDEGGGTELGRRSFDLEEGILEACRLLGHLGTWRGWSLAPADHSDTQFCLDVR